MNFKNRRKILSFIYRYSLRSFFLLILFNVNKSLANNCQNIGEIGTSGSCNGKLIVSRQNLLDAISDGSYAVIGPGNVSYTFAEGGTGDIYTGNINDFSSLFKGKKTFNQDIGYWDTSSATNMSEMFSNARRFNQDISNWDVSNVTKMNRMFLNARYFNQDINGWDVSNVEQINLMFRNAHRFNQSLNSWDVGNVTQMAHIFRSAKAFNGNISAWNTSKVKNFIAVFDGAKSFNQDISNWDVSSGTRMNHFLRNNAVFNKDLSSWDVRKFRSEPSHFAPNLLTAGGVKPCWGLNGCASADLIPVLSSYSPNNFDVSHGSNLDLELNFNMAVELVSKKSNVILHKMSGSNLKKVATYNLLKSEKVSFSDDKTKITINIGPKITDNTKYVVQIRPGSIKSSSSGAYFQGIQPEYQKSGSIWFSTGSNDQVLDIIGTTPSSGSNSLETENPQIIIRFSEDIALGTGNITLKKYSDDSIVRAFNVANSTDQEDLQINDTDLTIKLVDTNGDTLVVGSTKYYLQVDATAIDNAGSSKSFAGISNKDAYSYTTISASNCGAITGQAKYWKGKGAASSSVKIYRDNSLVDTKTTDDLGFYYFYPTQTGTYHVEFVKPTSNSNADKLTRAALSIPQGQVNSDDIVPVNSGRWVRNIEITTACEFHTEIDGLLIDPAGVIYDATTRQPVSGATVRLLYNGELVNNDWLDDSGGKNSQITSSDGQYSFTLKADSAADGTYTIEVLPPTAYKFQSSQIPVEGDTYSPQLGGSVEEIQDQEEAPASDQDTTYYLSFSFVFTNEAATTSNGVINNHIPIDPAVDPTTKADVNGLVEAWTNAAIRFNKSSVKAVDKRFDWLRSNQNSKKKSHQGINISFDNQLLEKALNGSSKRFKDLNNRDIESWARSNWSNERLKKESDQVFNDLIDNSVDLAFAELREKTFKPNLNPTGGELIGNWSVWTNGKILFGNKGISSKSSEQDINSLFLTLGIDKPYKENGLFGVAFNYGKDDISVGNAGSGIDSTNLGFNFYSSNLLKDKFPIESQIGFGKMDMNTKRIDNSTSHIGDRDVYMIFGSAKILAEPFKIKNFQLTPYGRLDLAHINLKAFSESGSSLALSFKDQTVNRKMVSLGVNVDRDFIFENWRLKPFLGISYGYDFTGDSIVDMNYVGDSQNYRIILDEFSSNNWNTNIGFEFFRDNDWSGSISYEYEKAGSSSHINSYQFNISWFF
jgi:surface protein